MIYVVEIPHQRPASCWVASHLLDFIARVAESSRGHSDTPDDSAGFHEWRDYLASDLHSLHIYMSDDEARAALADGTYDTGHQSALAYSALERKINSCGG